MTKAKISIADDPELKEEPDQEYELASQVQLCKYALKLAAHIRELINYSDPDNVTITKSLLINELWQKGIARVHDVRQASITIHQMAKTSEDAAVCAGLRVIGHAVATGHMREHAMVASDYAIRVTNLLDPENMEAVKKERLWQINHLKESKKPD